jgi:hypothetical protein
VPTEEELADLRERVERLERLARLVLEVVPVEWLLQELEDRAGTGEEKRT